MGRALTQSDREAADELCIHVTSFRKWRIRQGLPAKALPPGPLAEAEEQRRLKSWAESQWHFGIKSSRASCERLKYT